MSPKLFRSPTATKLKNLYAKKNRTVSIFNFNLKNKCCCVELFYRMNALGKIVIVAVVLILLFVITMLVIGHVSKDYGWNVYLNVNDADKPPYKEYVSGNAPEKTIYTNDHSLGQLYSAQLGGSGVPGEKILYTKMHVDEANYPNPTKRTELRASRFDDNTVVPSIDAVGGLVNPNAVLIQPGTTPGYSINFNDIHGKVPETVFGVENGVRYSYESGNRTVYLKDGTVITTFENGSKRTIHPDGKEEETNSGGVVATSDSSNSMTITIGQDHPAENAGSAAAAAAAAITAKNGGEGSVAADAEIAEAFSNFELMNIEGFEEFSKTYKAKRLAEGFVKGEVGNAKGLAAVTKGFPAYGADDFSQIVAARRLAEGLGTEETANVTAAASSGDVDEIIDSIGIADQGAPEYVYEIELENVLVEDIFATTSNDTDAVSLADSMGVDLNRGGREGLVAYPDRFYVDATGTKVYRRRRRATLGGWSGSYIDLNGNIHHHGAFEVVQRARPVRGWCLPHHRRRNVAVAAVSTWEPHNHKIKIDQTPRIFDSSFNATSAEFLTDNVLRYNPVGDLIVKPQAVFDSVYMLQ